MKRQCLEARWCVQGKAIHFVRQVHYSHVNPSSDLQQKPEEKGFTHKSMSVFSGNIKMSFTCPKFVLY